MSYILQAGRNSVTLGATDVLYLSNAGNAVAQVIASTSVGAYAAGTMLVASHTGDNVYGPFGAGTVRIQSIVGDLQYEVNPTSAPVTASTLGPGTPISMTMGQIAAAKAGSTAPLDSIFIGDSKTSQCFVSPSGFVSGYSPKWLVIGNAELGWPLNPINGGVSGDTSAQALVRLPALLAANPGPGWLFIRCIVNDIQSGNLVASNPTPSQVTKEMIVANLQSMIDLGVAAGKKIGICTDTGPTTGFAIPINAQTAYAALMRTAFSYVNTWIRNTCADNGYVCIDIESGIMDPATGLPVSGYIMADGVHVTYVGSAVEGAIFAAAMSGRTPVPNRVQFQRNSPRNLAGPVASQVGTVTVDAANDTRIIAPATAAGGIPSGWSISQFRAGGGAAGSKVARPATSFSPGTIAQMAFSSSGSYGGAGFWVGGDPTNVLSRWDLGWSSIGASSACAVGRRVNANGCSYVCVTAGTTSGSDPTAGWSTQEGSLITDNTVVFLCQRKPLAGESIQAVVDMASSSLVGNVSPRIVLTFRDTTGTDYATALSDLNLAGGDGIAAARMPSTYRFVSMPLVLPNSNIRYLAVQIGGYGENLSTVNMSVLGVDIINLSVAT